MVAAAWFAVAGFLLRSPLPLGEGEGECFHNPLPCKSGVTALTPGPSPKGRGGDPAHFSPISFATVGSIASAQIS